MLQYCSVLYNMKYLIVMHWFSDDPLFEIMQAIRRLLLWCKLAIAITLPSFCRCRLAPYTDSMHTAHLLIQPDLCNLKGVCLDQLGSLLSTASKI